MSHYILRYKGKGRKPAGDVEKVKARPGLKVLDEGSPRMMLVDAPESALDALAEALPDWTVSPEQIYQLPDPRPRLKDSPKQQHDKDQHQP